MRLACIVIATVAAVAAGTHLRVDRRHHHAKSLEARASADGPCEPKFQYATKDCPKTHCKRCKLEASECKNPEPNFNGGECNGQSPLAGGPGDWCSVFCTPKTPPTAPTTSPTRNKPVPSLSAQMEALDKKAKEVTAKKNTSDAAAKVSGNDHETKACGYMKKLNLLLQKTLDVSEMDADKLLTDLNDARDKDEQARSLVQKILEVKEEVTEQQNTIGRLENELQSLRLDLTLVKGHIETAQTEKGKAQQAKEEAEVAKQDAQTENEAARRRLEEAEARLVRIIGDARAELSTLLVTLNGMIVELEAAIAAARVEVESAAHYLDGRMNWGDFMFRSASDATPDDPNPCGPNHPNKLGGKDAPAGMCIFDKTRFTAMTGDAALVKKIDELVVAEEDCLSKVNENFRPLDREDRQCAMQIMMLAAPIAQKFKIQFGPSLWKLFGSAEARAAGVKCYDPNYTDAEKIKLHCEKVIYMSHTAKTPAPETFELRVAPECLAPLSEPDKLGGAGSETVNDFRTAFTGEEMNCQPGGEGVVAKVDAKQKLTKEQWSAMMTGSCYDTRIFTYIENHRLALAGDANSIQQQLQGIKDAAKNMDVEKALKGESFIELASTSPDVKDNLESYATDKKLQEVNFDDSKDDESNGLAGKVCFHAKAMIKLLKESQSRGDAIRAMNGEVLALTQSYIQFISTAETELAAVQELLKQLEVKRNSLQGTIKLTLVVIGTKKTELAGIKADTEVIKKDTKVLDDQKTAFNTDTIVINGKTEGVEQTIQRVQAATATMSADISYKQFEIMQLQLSLKATQFNLKPGLTAFNICNKWNCYSSCRIRTDGSSPPPQDNCDLNDAGGVTDTKVRVDPITKEPVIIGTFPDIEFILNDFATGPDAKKPEELKCITPGTRQETKEKLQLIAESYVTQFADSNGESNSIQIVGTMLTEITFLYPKPFDTAAPGQKTAPKVTKDGNIYLNGKSRAEYIKKAIVAMAKAFAAQDKKDKKHEAAVKKLEASMCADGWMFASSYKRVFSVQGMGKTQQCSRS